MAVSAITVCVASAQDLVWAEAHGHLLDAPEQQQRLLMGASTARGRQFLLSRVLRRWAVQRATGLAAQNLHFDADASGRPRVTHTQKQLGVTAPGPQVSLAHGSGHVAVAVASGVVMAVGIDVEANSRWAQEPHRATRISRGVCTPREQQRLQQVDPAFFSTAFLQVWALKEAVCKCVGQGLRGPWREVAADVPLGPLAPLECRWAESPVALPAPWAKLVPQPIFGALMDCGAHDGPVLAVAAASSRPPSLQCILVGSLGTASTAGTEPNLR